MGPLGALIMSFFGGVFFAWASVLAAGWRTPLLVVPVVVFAILAYAALQMIGRAPPGTYAPTKRAARIMSWASAAEGIAIPIVAMGLANTGHENLLAPGIAVVVGLHFLPMAWGIPFKPFYGLAASLLLASAIGLVSPQPAGSIFVGLVGSVTLWTASILALRRGRIKAGVAPA
jgi:hypothetical protein